MIFSDALMLLTEVERTTSIKVGMKLSYVDKKCPVVK